MKNRHAQEDADNAKFDLERQQVWYDDAEAEWEETKGLRDALVDEDTGEPSQEDKDEFDRLDGLADE
jgi:hypothetical protein